MVRLPTSRRIIGLYGRFARATRPKRARRYKRRARTSAKYRDARVRLTNGGGLVILRAPGRGRRVASAIETASLLLTLRVRPRRRESTTTTNRSAISTVVVEPSNPARAAGTRYANNTPPRTVVAGPLNAVTSRHSIPYRASSRRVFSSSAGVVDSALRHSNPRNRRDRLTLSLIYARARVVSAYDLDDKQTVSVKHFNPTR